MRVNLILAAGHNPIGRAAAWLLPLGAAALTLMITSPSSAEGEADLGGRFPLKGGNSNVLLLDVNMGETVTWTGKEILTIAESTGELITNPIAVLGTSARGDPVATSVGVFAGSPHDFEQIRVGVGSRSDEWPLCL
ncbi:MAG: hypothetical protein ACI9MR_003850 [Myxococcota bacterium]|jgi:hypothetical protein